MRNTVVRTVYSVWLRVRLAKITCASVKLTAVISINVDKQNQVYAKAIHDIWEKQKTSLADETEHSENEYESEPQFSVEDSFGVSATLRLLQRHSMTQRVRLADLVRAVGKEAIIKSLLFYLSSPNHTPCKELQ